MQQHLVDPYVIDALAQLVQLRMLIHYYKQLNCCALKVEDFAILVERLSDVAFDDDAVLCDESDGDSMMESELEQ